MALISTNIPTAASDVVGVFNAGFTQVFPTARPIKAVVRETSRAMEHPIEKGSIITDHRIILPNEIELSMILPAGDYRSVYQQIEQLFQAGTLLAVQTRTAIYTAMLITEIPHREDPDMFDTVSLALRLKQALIVSTQTQALPPAAVANPTQQSTINTGQQVPGPALALPPPSAFNISPTNPGMTLSRPPAAQNLPTPAPNAASYSNYTLQGTTFAPLTPAQIVGIGHASP